MPRRTRAYHVTLDLPDGASSRAAKAYVLEAVQSWHGSLQPPGADMGDGTYADGDPMFHLDPDTVTVRESRTRNRTRRTDAAKRGASHATTH